MQKYARIENGVVVEIVATAEDIGLLFHPLLHWVNVTGTAVQVGWQQGAGGTLVPAAPVTTAAADTEPPPQMAAVPAPPSLSDLLSELSTLRAQVAQLHIS
jgi:hypothetical protein